jgi:hypothetical protein
MLPMPLLWVMACQPDEPGQRPGPQPAEVPATFAGLDPLSRLARLSLDLRGVRPTREEMDRVLADPSALEALTEEFLADPRFEQRVLALYGEVFLTRTDDYYFLDYAAVERLVPDTDAFVAAASEEPLRLMAHLAMNDLPYDLAVTGDFTLVDDVLAPLWPTDRPRDASGWTVARYTDGRPAAGVLSTNGLWWRYASTTSNKQRKRGNTVSKLFACRDFLQTEVPFDNNVNLLDEDALNEAIRTNNACRSCHDDLDPISSYFWGFDFSYDDGFQLADGLRYHPERERAWTTETGVAPGWYGEPGSSLRDLGPKLLRDPVFDPCAVQHVYEHLLRRPAGDEDEVAMQAHVRSFRQNGRTIRSIWRAVLADPRYQGVIEEGVTGVPRKVVTPDLLRTAVLDLTGFDWTMDGVTLLDHEGYLGITTLAGGIDGSTVTEPATAPNTTTALVQDRLALGAASFAVQQGSPLLAGMDLSQAPEPEALAGLYATILTKDVSAGDPAVSALLELWSEVYALEGEPRPAWIAVLTVLLRDPDFVTY